MLQTLCDFFLLISTNKQTITQENLLTFHQFIINKIIQLETQYPSIITSSVNLENLVSISNNQFYFQNNNNDPEILIPKNNCKNNSAISLIQNNLLSLLYNMIDYFNSENIIYLNEKQSELLKKKISDKINEINIKNNNNEYFHNNLYRKDALVKKILKFEKINYIIELMKNSEIHFEIHMNDYINFFNYKNKSKNRNLVILFNDIIRPIIKLYKANKKNIHYSQNTCKPNLKYFKNISFIKSNNSKYVRNPRRTISHFKSYNNNYDITKNAFKEINKPCISKDIITKNNSFEKKNEHLVLYNNINKSFNTADRSLEKRINQSRGDIITSTEIYKKKLSLSPKNFFKFNIQNNKKYNLKYIKFASKKSENFLKAKEFICVTSRERSLNNSKEKKNEESNDEKNKMKIITLFDNRKNNKKNEDNNVCNNY